MKIIEVYLNIKTKKLDKPYYYLADDQVLVGERVLVPFGTGNREVEGFVTGEIEKTEEPLKVIISQLDQTPILNEKQIALLLEIHNHSLNCFYDLFENFKIAQFNSGDTEFSYKIKDKTKKPKTAIQKQVLSLLEENSLSFYQLKTELPKLTKRTLNALLNSGIIEVDLTGEEEKESGEYQKTQKFFKLLQNYEELLPYLKEEGQTLIIFPSISELENFKEFLDQEKISYGVFTGRQKRTDRKITYQKIKLGETKIILGTYSTLFLAFHDLKRVILIESGDFSYQTSEFNQFNIFDAAASLAEINAADFFATDFTRSITSDYVTQQKDFIDVTMEEPKTEFEVLNLRNKYEDPRKSLLNIELITKIRRVLKADKKVVLLFNRKGYYQSYFCLDCHKALKCPECDSILSSAKSGSEVLCKACGYTAKFPEKCPECGSERIDHTIYGLERVAEELRSIFPEKKVMEYYKFHEEDLTDADIIVGTKAFLYQKPLENVGMTAALYIDLDANFNDYSASEEALRLYKKLFLLYPEAEHIVQVKDLTLSIIDAIGGNTKPFLRELKTYREYLNLPPFGDLILITLSNEQSKLVKKEVEFLYDRIIEDFTDKNLYISKPSVLRGKKGVSQRRLTIKAAKDLDIVSYLKKQFLDGIFDFSSKCSIYINPGFNN